MARREKSGSALRVDGGFSAGRDEDILVIAALVTGKRAAWSRDAALTAIYYAVAGEHAGSMALRVAGVLNSLAAKMLLACWEEEDRRRLEWCSLVLSGAIAFPWI